MPSSNQKMLLNEKARNRDQRKMAERPDFYGKQRRKNVVKLSQDRKGSEEGTHWKKRKLRPNGRGLVSESSCVLTPGAKGFLKESSFHGPGSSQLVHCWAQAGRDLLAQAARRDRG